MTVRILIGDCREMLRSLPAESVQCVVTSPPYWGLRDYGVSGQLGMETTYQEHIGVMVEVFREVRRVLKDDGTCWVNYGDTYASSVNGRPASDVKAAGKDDRTFRDKPFSTVQGVLKPKDLCGIPWRFAFALQDDGWFLRQDIIWHKPNPMPESVRDRCTKAHEYVFLLTKSDRYFYNADAVAEDAVKVGTDAHLAGGRGERAGSREGLRGRTAGNKRHKYVEQFESGDAAHATKAGLLKVSDVEWRSRNKRSVWTIATAPFAEAHFATFPPELPTVCIKAGSRPGDTVLDPFGGAGTTGLVADRLGRDAVLCELNPEYAAMAQRRIAGDAPLFTDVSKSEVAA